MKQKVRIGDLIKEIGYGKRSLIIEFLKGFGEKNPSESTLIDNSLADKIRRSKQINSKGRDSLDAIPSYGRVVILDSNVFHSSIDVFKVFSCEDMVIIPEVVISELKTNHEGIQTKNLIKKINETSNFKRHKCYPELIPEKFKVERVDKLNINDHNDNLIMSIAIKIMDNNPLIVTDDGNFRINKLSVMGINSVRPCDYEKI